MATTATSTKSQVKVGNADTTIQSVVKDTGKDANGNRQFTTEVQRLDSTNNPTTIATVDASGKVTPSQSATADEKTALADPNSQLRQGVSKQVTEPKVQNTLGVSTDQDKKSLSTASGSASTANAGTTPTTPPQSGNQNSEQNPSLTKPQSDALNAEAGEFKEGTRAGDNAYSLDMKYPLDLAVEVQDVIKFSILEYSPSLAKENQTQGSAQFGSTKNRVVNLKDGSPVITGSKRIGMITLPIPTGISDGNTVTWQDDTLNALEEGLAQIAQGFFNGGISGASQAVENQGQKIQNAGATGDLQTAVKSFFLAQGVSLSAARRSYGAIANNNIELLFSGPSLRSFGFTFLFYPREPKEAKMVRQIIRAFKQSMSVKRSKTSLLLKAPHTFAISYMTAGGKMHPYLNKFKECALTSCSVDYTPDGTYMTYGGEEKSMTAYRLTLQFQELEPLFDDEYGKDDDNIGF